MELSALADRMQQIANGINRAVDKSKQQGAELALMHVLSGTPVDVGTARSNWQVGLASGPIGTIRRAYGPYKSRWKPRKGVNPGGSKGERANLFAALNVGKAKIRFSKTDEPIYISNDLPYIAPLNAGHSKQSAPGFVSRAVAKAASSLATKVADNLRKELT